MGQGCGEVGCGEVASDGWLAGFRLANATLFRKPASGRPLELSALSFTRHTSSAAGASATNPGKEPLVSCGGYPHIQSSDSKSWDEMSWRADRISRALISGMGRPPVSCH